MSVSLRDYETDTGPMDYTLAPFPDHAWQIVSVRLHVGAVGWFGDFTVTLDSAELPAHNVVFFRQDMTAVTDVYWEPDRPIVLRPEDNLRFQWINKFQERWGLETIWNLGAA